MTITGIGALIAALVRYKAKTALANIDRVPVSGSHRWYTTTGYFGPTVRRNTCALTGIDNSSPLQFSIPADMMF